MTYIVKFTTTFLTIPSASFKQYVLAKVPTENHFRSSCFKFATWRHSSVILIKKTVLYQKRQFSFLVNSLSDFLETFDIPNKCLQFSFSVLKIEIGSTKSKDDFFAHYHNDNIEHRNEPIRSLFRFGNNNSCIFSINNFQQHDNQCIPTKIVNLNHREIHHLQKNRFYVANKCEIFENNYDV